MTREEWCALPAAQALAILWDNSKELAARLASVPAPAPVRSPKYDQPIYRKGGFQWASEMDLSGLLYWQGKYAEGAASGSQYAEKDAARVKKLGFWIAWRRVEPNAIWSGIRNDTQVTADAPRAKPFIFEREQKRDETYQEPLPGSDTESTFGDDDSQIPF